MQADGELVGHYPGHGRLEFTQNLEVIDPTLFKQVPVYQVLDTTGNLICDSDEVQVYFICINMIIICWLLVCICLVKSK